MKTWKNHLSKKNDFHNFQQLTNGAEIFILNKFGQDFPEGLRMSVDLES